jgi:death-on-curing protein
MQYLTREDLLDLHTYVVIRYGGLFGIASQDKLNMVLHAPRQELFGTQLYRDVCGKAAALMYFIIKNHPFVSGNNTTALLAMLRFLEINGLHLHQHIDAAALSGLVRALNRSEMNREGLESWLRDNALPRRTE